MGLLKELPRPDPWFRAVPRDGMSSSPRASQESPVSDERKHVAPIPRGAAARHADSTPIMHIMSTHARCMPSIAGFGAPPRRTLHQRDWTARRPASATYVNAKVRRNQDTTVGRPSTWRRMVAAKTP